MGDYRRPTVRPLDATVSTGITDHELRLVHQFTGRFLPVLLLPSLGPRDYDEFESQMISMMLRYKCVKYAVLAGSASNRYMLSNEVAYQKRALAYYSQAMHEVGACLSDMTKTGQSPGNETLIAVVFLYLYNVSLPLPAINVVLYVFLPWLRFIVHQVISEEAPRRHLVVYAGK